MRTATFVLGCLCLSVSVFAAKKFTMTSTPVSPASIGKVETKTDKNGNTVVKIKVEHLAPPQNLEPPRVGYLVWFTEHGGSPESQGRMRIDKNLKASFETTTPMKSFDIIITAENDPNLKAPSGPEVLKTTVAP